MTGARRQQIFGKGVLCLRLLLLKLFTLSLDRRLLRFHRFGLPLGVREECLCGPLHHASDASLSNTDVMRSGGSDSEIDPEDVPVQFNEMSKAVNDQY